jgi:type III pantothenate kinase
MNDLSLVAVSVGNSRTAIALFEGADASLQPSSIQHLANAEREGIVAAVGEAWARIADQPDSCVAVASVSTPVSLPLLDRLRGSIGDAVQELGEEIGVPIGTQLDPESVPGIDRLLNAAAAWSILRSACVIVDAGTAVTVDFVDGAGTFQGGAIAPGARMQLQALHEGTSALPAVELAAPDEEAFAKNTRDAMLQGVVHGIRGLVWRLVERYAEHYGAFPTVIATGGDAALLFERDELIDRLVPELTLMGIAVSLRTTE